MLKGFAAPLDYRITSEGDFARKLLVFRAEGGAYGVDLSRKEAFLDTMARFPTEEAEVESIANLSDLVRKFLSFNEFRSLLGGLNSVKIHRFADISEGRRMNYRSDWASKESSRRKGSF